MCAAPQVAELPNLAALTLNNCRYSAESLAMLSRLSGSLAWLDLNNCGMPPTVSGLTRLQSLCLSWDEDGWPDVRPGKDLIEDALQHLTLLTSLVRVRSMVCLPMLSAALPALPALQCTGV